MQSTNAKADPNMAAMTPNSISDHHSKAELTGDTPQWQGSDSKTSKLTVKGKRNPKPRSPLKEKRQEQNKTM